MSFGVLVNLRVSNARRWVHQGAVGRSAINTLESHKTRTAAQRFYTCYGLHCTLAMSANGLVRPIHSGPQPKAAIWNVEERISQVIWGKILEIVNKIHEEASGARPSSRASAARLKAGGTPLSGT
jgi:hypothetical protein